MFALFALLKISIKNNQIMAQLSQKWERIMRAPKAASTAFDAGYFISYDGSGHVIPAESASLYGTATKIRGVILEDILSTDDDFTSTRKVSYQDALGFVFTVPVGIGTATASMIGSLFDVDGVNPGAIDVSGAGTQLKIVEVISSTLVRAQVSDVEPLP